MAVFNDRSGNQTYRGRAQDYDQVDYTGSLLDYTFTRNDDGSVTVTHPTLGTDTLFSIEGFWFSGEGAWYSLDDAIALTAGNTGDGVFTDANGVITGGDGDNRLIGSNQNDVFYASMGDDIINGGGGNYNQGEYDGALVEYTLTRNNDGSVTMSHPTWGTDTLIDIDGLWFIREQAWYSLDDAVEISGREPEFRLDDDNVLNGTPGNDVMRGDDDGMNFYGGTGNDRYVGRNDSYDQVNYDGDIEDYTITELSNGNVRITHPVWGRDTLVNIDGLWFGGRGEWYSVDQAVDFDRDDQTKPELGDVASRSLGSDFDDFAYQDAAPTEEFTVQPMDVEPMDEATPEAAFTDMPTDWDMFF